MRYSLNNLLFVHILAVLCVELYCLWGWYALAQVQVELTARGWRFVASSQFALYSVYALQCTHCIMYTLCSVPIVYALQCTHSIRCAVYP